MGWSIGAVIHKCLKHTSRNGTLLKMAYSTPLLK
jgi:hypothetical protein